MATISAADLTLLRQQRQSARLYLSVLQPATLLAARVNNIAIARGDRSIAYDTGTGSGFATIESGNTLLVGTAAGDYDVGTVRVKSIAGAQAAGTITIDENAIDWVDDLYLTVLHEYRIWPVPPRSDRSTGVFYKFYSTAYTDENSEPSPVSLVGFPTYAGFLSGGSIAISLNAGNSYVTAQGAAIASYAWVCVHNGGSTANISFSDTLNNTSAIQAPTLTISAADTYWLKLTVTDDNGKTQSTYRPLFIYADSTGPYRNFTVSNLSGDWNSVGWSFNVEVFGDVALSDFPDGTFALLWYQNYFNSVEDYVNLWGHSNEIVCSGYIQRETDDDDLAETGTGNVSFTVVSPAGVLANKSISPGTVELEAVTSPTTWYQYANWMTAGRAVHHLLKWQSTVMETCEVVGLLNNTIQVYQVAFTEDSLLDMINNFAYEIGHFAKLCANRLGELHFVSDIQYYNEADRAAEDTIFSIVAQDLSGTIQLARAPVKTTAFAFLDGVDFDGTAPGTAYTFGIPAYTDSIGLLLPEFDGRGSINKTQQILASETDGQEKCGRVLAVANNPLREMRLDLRANYLGAFDIIPNQGWYSWGLANADLKRSLSLNSTKWLCRRVEIRQTLSGDLFSGDITTGVVLEGEAFGPDGITLDYPTDYPTPTLPTPNWSLTEDIVYSCATLAYTLVFDVNAIGVIDGGRMDSNTMGIFYVRSTNKGYAVITDWTNPDLTLAAGPTQITTNNIHSPAIDGIDSNYALLAYKDDSDDEVYVRIIQYSSSGGTITAGAATMVSGGTNAAGNQCDVVVLSNTGGIVTWIESGNLKAMVVTLNTPTRTVSTNASITVAASSGATTHSVTYFGAAVGYAAVAYWRANEPRIKSLAIAGTSLTAGSEVDVDDQGRNADFIKLDNFSTTKAIVTYADGINTYPTAAIINRSGATLTAETAVTVKASAAGGSIQSTTFNNISAAIVYEVGPTLYGQLLDESGTPLTNTGSEFSIANILEAGSEEQSSNEFMVLFGDNDVGNQGTAKLYVVTEC